jgi:extracellular factor (EF) 3-hydroxypalmitic acid methyl ester biosynthesis protein
VVWQFILRSEFLTRTNLKPRGYSGDAEMMAMAYENQYRGARVFDQLLHRHPLMTPAAHAVRNRRKVIAAEMSAATPGRVRRFFSVACGPACELSDVLTSAELAGRWEGLLLDQDSEALDAARREVEGISARVGVPLEVGFVNDSVRTMLRTAELAARFGTFDFVYSMGLFDYLTPPVARVVLRRLAALLRPGGTLVVGNYDLGNPTRHYMAFWMDWVLYLRSEADLLALAEGLEGVRASVSRDSTGAQLFLRLERG